MRVLVRLRLKDNDTVIDEHAEPGVIVTVEVSSTAYPVKEELLEAMKSYLVNQYLELEYVVLGPATETETIVH